MISALIKTASDIYKVQPTFYATLFVGLLAALIALRALRHNVQAAKTKNSLDFESTYKHNEKIVKSSLEIKKIIKRKLDVPISSLGLEENFQREEALHISAILNEWERCANGIYHKVYDDDFLYGTYGSTVIFLYTHLYPYIEVRQKHNPRVFTKFCWLALKWQIRRDKNTGKKTDRVLSEALELLSTYHKNVNNL